MLKLVILPLQNHNISGVACSWLARLNKRNHGSSLQIILIPHFFFFFYCYYLFNEFKSTFLGVVWHTGKVLACGAVGHPFSFRQGQGTL